MSPSPGTPRGDQNRELLNRKSFGDDARPSIRLKTSAFVIDGTDSAIKTAAGTAVRSRGIRRLFRPFERVRLEHFDRVAMVLFLSKRGL